LKRSGRENKMRVLRWLFGANVEEKYERYERMPDFRKNFVSLPDIVKATKIQSVDTHMQNVVSVQERAEAKDNAERETRAAISKEKVLDVYSRIQTAKRRNKEIVWLLQVDTDIRHTSLNELIASHRNLKDAESYRGMSVNYSSEGKLHEISPLVGQDLEGLAKKMESGSI